MALIDLAQKAEQAFSQITTAEQDLNSLHHGDVARNALVQCYAFGVHAKRINTEFKSLCIERHIPPNGFNWTAAVRCVYGTFQPIEKGSNVTEWIVSPSNPVISKYARVLAHAENLKWDTKQLTKQLSQHGIDPNRNNVRNQPNNSKYCKKTRKCCIHQAYL